MTERKDLKEKAELAIDTFRACRIDEDKDQRMLMEMPFNKSIRRMIRRATEHLPQGGESDSTSASCDSSKKCSELLATLTSETAEDGEGCYWPYVRRIRYVAIVHCLLCHYSCDFLGFT